MAIETFVIQSIWEGQMPSALFGATAQFLTSLGIDPDMPLTDNASDVKASGAIRPVNYAAFSSSQVTAPPIAIVTTPKDSNVYAILSNGRLVSYNSSLGSESLVGTVAGSNAAGGWYYNNYIYITGTGASKDDVSRYGPLDNSPSLVDGVWKGSTLGSETALVNTSYPTALLSVGYPNHWGISHVDGSSYFLDYKAGIGYVHKIKTMKTTNEGDTNNASAYGVLDLPVGYIPITIERYGTDLVVAATLTTSSSIRQGPAALFFWDTTSDSFYRVVSLPDSLCSALIYNNGELRGLSGDLAGGYRLFRYVGGDAIETLAIIEDGLPPLAGAISAVGNRTVWGANTTYPMVSSGLLAYGSKSDKFPRGLHHIALSGFT